MRKIALGLLLLASFGCAESEMKVSTPDNNKEKPVIGNEVCFLVDGSCFTTIDQSLLNDPANEFKYKNPDDFPNSQLRPQYKMPNRFIDLDNINGATAISPNFLLGEFASIAKGRYAILQRHMIIALQNIRNAIGASLRINSGYRSPGYNSNLDGAASWSRHTYGDAADMFSANASLNKLKELCLDQAADFFQLYKKHIHCDWRKSKLDPAFFDPSVDDLPLTVAANKVNAKIVPTSLRGGLLQLAVNDFEQEDEGELIYSWSVTLPNGQTLDYDTPDIQLPRMPGLYHTEVTVGGSTVIRQEFIWSE